MVPVCLFAIRRMYRAVPEHPADADIQVAGE
jgi:hypothetical protein